VIFDGAIGFPDNLVAADGSVAIRIVKDEFCRHLIKRLRNPIVSTSANISGEPAPKAFKEISEKIKNGVDHIVQWRQDDDSFATPSQLIKWQNGQAIFFRK
jgi:L-threonylcarbamoyladenylate synthase